MPSIFLVILVGLAGGMAIGLQSPMASIITQRLGIFESVFIVHLGGAAIALLALFIIRGGHLAQWRIVPWYALFAGFFGLLVIAAISYIIPRAGVTAAITTTMAGQLIVGTVLDQFGLLGAAGRPMDVTRVLGLIFVMAGVWLTVK